MLAVKLHRAKRPRLVKEAFLVSIVDWKSGRPQIRAWLRWRQKDRYITLARRPVYPVFFEAGGFLLSVHEA